MCWNLVHYRIQYDTATTTFLLTFDTENQSRSLSCDMAASHHSSANDVEKHAHTDHIRLSNESVHSFSWSNISVKVKHRRTKQPVEILSDVRGLVSAGL